MTRWLSPDGLPAQGAERPLPESVWLCALERMLSFSRDRVPSGRRVSGKCPPPPLGMAVGRGGSGCPEEGSGRKLELLESQLPAERAREEAGPSVRRPRGECAALSFKLSPVSVRASARCDQSEPRDGNKLCKSPSGDGSDDSHTFKNYLYRSVTAASPCLPAAQDEGRSGSGASR